MSWARSGAAAIGTQTLGKTVHGDLVAEGIFESLVFHFHDNPAYTHGVEKILNEVPELELEPRRAPSAEAVQSGRAALDGDRYYEAIRPGVRGESWLLARGRIPESGGRARGEYLLVFECAARCTGECGLRPMRGVERGWAEGGGSKERRQWGYLRPTPASFDRRHRQDFYWRCRERRRPGHGRLHRGRRRKRMPPHGADRSTQRNDDISGVPGECSATVQYGEFPCLLGRRSVRILFGSARQGRQAWAFCVPRRRNELFIQAS